MIDFLKYIDTGRKNVLKIFGANSFRFSGQRISYEIRMIDKRFWDYVFRCGNVIDAMYKNINVKNWSIGINRDENKEALELGRWRNSSRLDKSVFFGI